MSSSILDVIGHYQRSIERSQNGSNDTNKEKLLHSIGKLYKLPVTVDHLQETGIGKTVNSLRKYDGEVGVAAKALVAKWKAMVTAEEYAAESLATNKMETDDDDDNNNNGDDENANDDCRIYNNQKTAGKSSHTRSEKYTDYKETHSTSHLKDVKSKNTSSLKDYQNGDCSNNKSKHSSDSRSSNKSSHHNSKKENGSESMKALTPTLNENLEMQMNDEDKMLKLKKDKHHSSNRDKNHSSSSSRVHHHKSVSDSKSISKSSSIKHRKEDGRKNHTSSSSSKEKNRHHSSSNEKDEKKSKDHSSNINDKSNKDSKTSKRRHSTNDPVCDLKSCEVTSSSSSSSKSGNKNKVKKTVHHDEIDSTTGTSFEDALGMMMVPTKMNGTKTFSKIKSPISEKSNNKSSKNSTNNSHNNKKSNGSATKTSTTDCDETITPQLLTSSVNLKPLDPSIALELPTISISNNYKPMPLNQTVMDCVFRSTNQSQKTLRTDAETLTHSISSKTMRTKVYSGIKSGQIHQVPKLFDLCIRFLQKNIDSIEYCGGYPYEVLRHFLERATPTQLSNFEEWNQYIIEDTDELWHQHVLRHYRGHKREEMESWREMFMRCKESQEQRLSMLAENIKQSQKLVAAPIKKTQLAFVDSMVKPPRNIQRKQDQFGTNKKLVATPAARVASLCSLTPNATKTGDVRLRIMAGERERDNAQVSGFARPKKAPLMAKALQLMKGRTKR